jgi:hypothetical protein
MLLKVHLLLCCTWFSLSLSLSLSLWQISDSLIRCNATQGLDICALDVIHTTDDKEYILELNDSAIGLSPDHVQEDNILIRDLVLRRMNELIRKQEAKPMPLVADDSE